MDEDDLLDLQRRERDEWAERHANQLLDSMEES